MRSVAFIVLFAAAMATVPACGQKLFDFGVKAGANMDDLSTGYAHSAMLGGNVGLFMRFKPPVVPGVQGELLISSLGSRVTVENRQASIRGLALQLPVFAIFSLGPLELSMGCYYQIGLGKEWMLSPGLTVEGNEVSLPITRSGTYGILAGAGLHVGHFYLGARYDLGLQDLSSGPYLGGLRDRQVQIHVGWGFF